MRQTKKKTTRSHYELFPVDAARVAAECQDASCAWVSEPDFEERLIRPEGPLVEHLREKHGLGVKA